MERVSDVLTHLPEARPALTADEIDAAAKRISDIIEPTPCNYARACPS